MEMFNSIVSSCSFLNSLFTGLSGTQLPESKNMKQIHEISIDVETDTNWKLVAQQIRQGLGGIGFIYLKNHGIDKSVIEKAFVETKKFFDLPQETKMKYKKGKFDGDIKKYAGYTEPGQELLHPTSVQELRESYDLLNGIGVYPDTEAPEFYSSINLLQKQSNELAKKILILWAMSLDLEDSQYFLKRCTNLFDNELPPGGNMRTLHYPPIPEEIEITRGTVRLGEHSDYGMLTLLFQDMIGGLEVQNVDGKWIPATPVDDTIVVNTGDLLELWSAGVFPATKHRVMIPNDEVLKRAERYSIACFIGPNVDTVVGSLKVKKTEPERKRIAARNPLINYDTVKPVVAMDYVMNRLIKAYTKP